METASLKQKLIEFDIQPSAPRLAVASFVLNTQNHPTAEEVKAVVEGFMPSVSTATIYNTLNLFVEKGLLRRILDPIGDKTRYDCNTHPHFHFYDEETGQLMDLDPSFLRLKPNFDSLHENFIIHSVDVTIRGKMKSKPVKEK